VWRVSPTADACARALMIAPLALVASACGDNITGAGGVDAGDAAPQEDGPPGTRPCKTAADCPPQFPEFDAGWVGWDCVARQPGGPYFCAAGCLFQGAYDSVAACQGLPLTQCGVGYIDDWHLYRDDGSRIELSCYRRYDEPFVGRCLPAGDDVITCVPWPQGADGGQ